MFTKILNLNTTQRGTYPLTDQIMQCIKQSKLQAGLCNLFALHTSCSLIICENADPNVRDDLETFLSALVKDGDPRFKHIYEGPDDMPAHIRSILTQTSLTLPFENESLILGHWQGIYLYEHRLQMHNRKIQISLLGS